MRKLFTFFLLFITLTIQATTWYLDDTGSDVTGNGSIGNPWKTLSKALLSAVYGDIIHFKPGTYALGNSTTEIGPGISLEGEGTGSLITSSYAGSDNNRHGTLKFIGQAADGNQSIHDLRFNGLNTAGKTAIVVTNRGGVDIYNCTFENFNHSAVIFYGGTSTWIIDADAPTEAQQFLEGTYAEGNTYHHNISTNCSRTIVRTDGGTWDNTGHLFIQGQKDLLIYNNTFNQVPGRAAGTNGMCIKGVEGFFKGVKVYNNTMYQTPYANEVGFSMEFWFSRGGLEVYNNTFPMQLDLARGIVKGDYSFSAQVHHNTIGHPTLYALCKSPCGIKLEWDVQDAYIYNNIISKFGAGISLYADGKESVYERLYIYYNLIYDIINIQGNADMIRMWSMQPLTPSVFNDIHIFNNVLYGKVINGTLTSGISLPTYDHITNFYIKNNIIMTNNASPPIRGVQPVCVVNRLVITNNIFWNCGNANNPSLLSNYTSTNYTNSANIKANPSLVNPAALNFRINDGSPAIDKGVHLPFSFITTDYIGAVIGSPPEIGAYESGPTIPAVLATVTTTAITDIMLTTASGGGNVLDDGGASVTARGVVWDIVTGPTLADNSVASGSGLGLFTSSLTGLTQNTSYFVKAYATNSVGTNYGNEVTFTTGPPEQAEVATGIPIRLTDSTATGSGNVLSAGGGTVSARGVCWSVSIDPTLADSFATASTAGLGEYTVAMTGLSPTIYYVRAWATNETTTVYGDNIIFSMAKGVLWRFSGDTLAKDTNGDLIRVR